MKEKTSPTKTMMTCVLSAFSNHFVMGCFVTLPRENLPVPGVEPTIITFSRFNYVGGTTRCLAQPYYLQVLKIVFH